MAGGQDVENADCAEERREILLLCVTGEISRGCFAMLVRMGNQLCYSHKQHATHNHPIEVY